MKNLLQSQIVAEIFGLLSLLASHIFSKQTFLLCNHALNLGCLICLIISLIQQLYNPSTKLFSLISEYQYIAIGGILFLFFIIEIPLQFYDFFMSFLILAVAKLIKDLLQANNSISIIVHDESQIVQKPKKTAFVDGETILELIPEGLFLCKSDNGPAIHKLAYSNAKGDQILEDSNCNFEELIDTLANPEKPSQTLRTYLYQTINEEMKSATVIKAILTLFPRKAANTETLRAHSEVINTSPKQTPFKSIPFKNYKAVIQRLSKTFILLNLREYDTNTALGSLEGIKSAIACTLSHELKTLANGIIGSIELLGDSTYNSQEKVHHTIAASSSYMLGNKLNDLFDYIQIQNKAFKLHYADFLFDELLKEVYKICSFYAKEKQLTFKINKDENLPQSMLGDKARIKQVLVNLISKSIEFTDYGNIELLIRAKEENSQVIFKVNSYGDSMQSKMEEQVIMMMPNSSSFQLNNKNPLEATHNLDALSLQISQLLCKQMNTQLVAKQISKGLYQLKLIVSNGFSNIKRNKVEETNPFKRSVTKSAFNYLSTKGTGFSKKTNQMALRAKQSFHEIKIITPRHYPQENSQKAVAEFAIDEEFPEELKNASCIKVPSIECKTLLKKNVQLKKKQNENNNIQNENDILRKNTLRPIKTRRASADLFLKKHAGRKSILLNMDDVEKCSILIVDDDTINRLVLKALLKKQGYNSIEVRDGKEAVMLIERYVHTQKMEELKLIFMDLQMPRMNGIEATKEILKICRTSKQQAPPILGVSADSHESDRIKFLEAGIEEFMCKPIDCSKIENAVKTYIIKKEEY